MRMSRWGASGRRRLLGAVTAAALIACASIAPTGSAVDFDYADCWFSAKSHKLTIKTKHAEEAGIRRQGGRIRVVQPTGLGGFKPLACVGGKAKVGNTDRIKFIVNTREGLTTGRIFLAGGPFAPGRAEEVEAPEIEIKVVLGGQGDLQIDGTPGPDQIRGGTMGTLQGLNLNPGAELVSPDADISLRKLDKRRIIFAPGAGDDLIDLGGGPEFLGPLAPSFNVVYLGDGNDRLIGSSGPDAIDSLDGTAEIIDCGLGTDLVQPDQTDTLIGCEMTGSFGEH